MRSNQSHVNSFITKYLTHVIKRFIVLALVFVWINITQSVISGNVNTDCTGGGIYLYEHSNFEGNCMKFTNNHNNLEALGFNDLASSIRFAGSYAPWQYQVTLCEHADYGGNCSPFFIGDDPNLGDNTVKTDRTSSLRIESTDYFESIRIGTLNAQAISTIFFISETHNGCCEDIPNRSNKLAAQIIASQYDIIAFNEIFDEDIREELIASLKEYYPYQVQYLDGTGEDVDEDSGLMLLSRFPFEPLPNDQYIAGDVEAQAGDATWSDVAFIEFNDVCSNDNADDCWANKGVGYIRIRNPLNDRIYNVAFTHLDAGSTKEDENARVEQLKITEKLIRGSMTPQGLNEEDIFFLGDLNIQGELYTSRPEEERTEWDMYFNTSGSFFTEVLADTWAYEVQPSLTLELRDQGFTGGIHEGPSITIPPDSITGSTAVTGDIDGNGRDEVIVGRSWEDGQRWAAYQYNSARNNLELLQEGGDSWGDDHGVTALATGDMNGDGRAELVIGRNASEQGDMRWEAYRYNPSTGQLEEFQEGGNGWGGDHAVTALAMGDVNGDGRAELVIGRNASEQGDMRWEAYRYNPSTGQLQVFQEGGNEWGDDRAVTALGMGDVDGDGRTELAIGRNGDDNMRWAIYRYHATSNRMVTLYTGGPDWDEGHYPTSITFGDVTGSGQSQLGIAAINVLREPFLLYSTNFFNIPHSQNRLDYILRNASPPATTNGQLCVQHMTVAYNLRHGEPVTEAAFGQAGFQDLSDHYGMNADLNIKAPYCSPAEAKVNPTLDSFLRGKITYPGSVQWYRFDSSGTYSFALYGGKDIDYQVYQSTDLSSPIQRASVGASTNLWSYHIPRGVFYVKIFSHDRTWRGEYRFIAHKHFGKEQDDARTLYPNVVSTYDFLVQPTPEEEIWYRINTEAPDSGQAQNLRFFAELLNASGGEITVELRAEDGSTILESATGSRPEILRKYVEDNNAELYLVIRPSSVDDLSQLKVGWETNLTVLHGTLPFPLKLQADAQTADEFGIAEDDDDVKITMEADSNIVVDSINLGDFDEGQVRGLGDVFTTIRFLEVINIRLVEDDGGLSGEDDVMTGEIQALPVEISGSNPGRFFLTGDGGIYDFFFNRSHSLPYARPSRLILRGNHYVPVVADNPGPDLIVENIEIASNGMLAVVISNKGPLPTTYPFWVDLYFDPEPAPEQPNDIWADGRSKYGLVWHIDPYIQPDESITLTIGDPNFRPHLSRIPGSMPGGTPVYVQVDSANTETNYGGVHEMHEVAESGLSYNNIVSIILEEDVIFETPSALPSQNEGTNDNDLPIRPERE